MKRQTDPENEMLFKGYSIDEPLNLLVLVKNAVLHGPSEEFHCYVTVKLQNVKSTTQAVKGNNPSWEQEFIFETNRLDQGLLIELWNKGVLWDKLLGVHHIPLTMIPYSPVPGTGYYIGIDKEFEMRNGVTIGSRTPTGHTLMIDVRFELPFDAQEEEIISFQNKLQALNNINYQNVPNNTTTLCTSEFVKINAPTQNFSNHLTIADNVGNKSLYGNDFSVIEDSNRHPFIRSGISEDSDYTSDVSFPINHHQQNTATNHWNNQSHPPNGYIQRDAGEYKEQNYHMDVNCQEMQHISGYDSQFDNKQLNDHSTHEEDIYYTNIHNNSENYTDFKDQLNTIDDGKIGINSHFDYSDDNRPSGYYNSMAKYLDDNEYVKNPMEITHQPHENYYIPCDKDMISVNEVPCYQNYYPVYQDDNNHQDNIPHMQSKDSIDNYNFQNTYHTQYDDNKYSYDEGSVSTHVYSHGRYDDYKADTPTSSRTLYESDKTNIPYLPSSATASDSDFRGIPLVQKVSNTQQRRDVFRKDSNQMRLPTDDEFRSPTSVDTNKIAKYDDESDDFYYQSGQDIDIYHQDYYETVSDTTNKQDWKNDDSSLIIDNTEPLSYNSRSVTYYNKKVPEYYIEYDTVPTADSSNEDNQQYYLQKEEEGERYDHFEEKTLDKPIMSKEELEIEYKNNIRKNKYKELWKKAYFEVCKQVGLKVSF
uniref:C2 domain-containing protein n=1 Tax=Strongyloides venezuelensis TaxID=75913 RepID=A0A0K0F6L4_STRVS